MSELFDTTAFVPRASCGTGWTPDKIWWDNAANLLVFGAYVVLPVMLFWMFYWVRKALPKPEKGGKGTDEWRRLAEAHPLYGFPAWVIASFGLFILSCGIGHVWEVAVFRWPAYNFFIAWNILTGVASWVAVGGAFAAAGWLSRKFLKLWGTLEESIDKLEAALEREEAEHKAKDELADALAHRNLQLEQLAQSLQAELETARCEKERKGHTDMWANAKHTTLDRLLANVQEIAADVVSRRPDS